MNKLIVCLISFIILLNCAPVYEVYIEPGNMKEMSGKIIVSKETVKTDAGIMLHIKYKDKKTKSDNE